MPKSLFISLYFKPGSWLSVPVWPWKLKPVLWFEVFLVLAVPRWRPFPQQHPQLTDKEILMGKKLECLILGWLLDIEAVSVCCLQRLYNLVLLVFNHSSATSVIGVSKTLSLAENSMDLARKSLSLGKRGVHRADLRRVSFGLKFSENLSLGENFSWI